MDQNIRFFRINISTQEPNLQKLLSGGTEKHQSCQGNGAALVVNPRKEQNFRLSLMKWSTDHLIVTGRG